MWFVFKRPFMPMNIWWKKSIASIFHWIIDLRVLQIHRDAYGSLVMMRCGTIKRTFSNIFHLCGKTHAMDVLFYNVKAYCDTIFNTHDIYAQFNWNGWVSLLVEKKNQWTLSPKYSGVSEKKKVVFVSDL